MFRKTILKEQICATMISIIYLDYLAQLVYTSHGKSLNLEDCIIFIFNFSLCDIYI